MDPVRALILNAWLVLIALTPGPSISTTLHSPSLAEKSDSAVIIAHPDVETKGLNLVALKNIFLGKTTTWGDKKKIVFVNLSGGEIHKDFTKRYTSKTTSQYKRYWKKRVFTGKGNMPRCFATEKALLDYVSRTPGAIGYISKKQSEDADVMTDSKTKKAKVQVITAK